MKKILIYTTDYCPYCERAKKLLKSKGYAYEEVKLTEEDDQAWTDLEAKTHFKTVPQIFIDGKFQGGFTELAALDQKGELSRLVEA